MGNVLNLEIFTNKNFGGGPRTQSGPCRNRDCLNRSDAPLHFIKHDFARNHRNGFVWMNSIMQRGHALAPIGALSDNRTSMHQTVNGGHITKSKGAVH